METNKLSKKVKKLLIDFDVAAKDWGWIQDQGSRIAAEKSKKMYNDSKLALIKFIALLEKKVKNNGK